MSFRSLFSTAPSRGVRDVILVAAGALLSAGLLFGVSYDSVDGVLRRWTEHDLTRRAEIIASTLDRATIENATLRGTDAGVVVCTAEGNLVARTPRAAGLDCRSAVVRHALASVHGFARASLDGRRVFVTAHALPERAHAFVVQDRGFLDQRRGYLLQVLFISAELAIIALLLFARAGSRIGGRRVVEEARGAIRQIRRRPESEVPPHLRLLVRDMEDVVEDLRSSEIAASGVDRLRAFIDAEFPSGGLVMIANREPYAHEFDDRGEVAVSRPASGLVTAMEPILRACGGTWIAHGGGGADRQCTGSDGKLMVPPDKPEYTLRRVWIDRAEYEAYYSGLANDALWPLCHNAYAKPVFRDDDWEAYRSVNARFARAAVVECSADSMLLIQDYHFALVPRLVREMAPSLVTSLFWHIPWPSSDTIRICPWKESLLEGMMGADVIGFHTRRYCLNFLETVQEFLECRVDFEEMSVTHRGHSTFVRDFPISIEWPFPAASRADGNDVRAALGVAASAHLTLGVDRADYTKGLLERIESIELLLERTPSLHGKHVFVQLACPTRSNIERYRSLLADVEAAVLRVNARFGTDSWKPIILQCRSFAPEEVRRYYAAANSALVTPLHDGMNLVAKEYVGSCVDDDGVLILSEFAGAAREMDGALLVNPYDIGDVADAILRAVQMPSSERRARMQRMRDQIASHSIYDWSQSLLRGMCEARNRRARFWPRSSRNAKEDRRVIAG